MTATINKTCDVFISHAAADTDVAGQIAESLEVSGLRTFHSDAMQPGEDLGDVIWDALAESRAVIAIVSPDAPMHAMGLVEIGGAAAWNKPIFLVINGPSSTRLPPALSGYPVYPLSRVEEVVREIRTGFEPLTDEERNVLAEIYRDVKAPADELSQSPKLLRDLTTKFNRSTHQRFTAERLLSEILRMRKSGRLPRL